MVEPKLIYNVFLLLIIVAVSSCSNDSENLNDPTETNLNLENQRLLNGSQAKIGTNTYDQYAIVLDSLYTNGYEILDKTTEIKDHGKSYLVTEVHVNSILKGFFVEFPAKNKAVYLDRNGDFVTLYDNMNTKDPVQTFDLKQDPNYKEIGFSPYQSEENTEAGRFWGWGSQTSNPYYCGDGTNSCMCVVTSYTYYVFFVAVINGGSNSSLIAGSC